ncbi:MAG: AMP-binding protein [Proteobacteria bacterium]|nr:AMP-binding protein [Pseudomonadota bacterium]MBU1714113.1 AMP-binding protein [Pseudomonadota bacterium]
MENYNIAQALSEVAIKTPERTALLCPTAGRYQGWTFAEIERHVSAYAHGLTRVGVVRGDRVILMVRPSLEFICLTFALFRIGAPVILIDPGMGYKNLLRCIGSVQPDVFIGIPAAHLFRNIFPAPFKTIRIKIMVGTGFGLFGISLRKIADFTRGSFLTVDTAKDDLAAIIFTTGSTGPPKGVQYGHGIFQAQLRLIKDYYGIKPEDVDQPAFPLFALFTVAMGACAVIPDMNPAHPAKVDPAKFVSSIQDYQVTYSFGSPAIWNVISRYCLARKIKLPSLKKILMAGAPVSGELIARVKGILSADAEIHTPYGATESLPIASLTGTEILAETWNLTRTGHGTCVGRPLPGMEIRIITAVDGPISQWSEVRELAGGEIGEIVVKGDVVTRAYDHNDKENLLAKIIDGDEFWHRIGDVGYLDDNGRLWFCGRKGHRVKTRDKVMDTIPCEAIFNEHPQVYRSALVGVKDAGNKFEIPVIIFEPYHRVSHPDQLLTELAALAQGNVLTSSIKHFLMNPAFPVDIRHNAKIFREKLAVWAAKRI